MRSFRQAIFVIQIFKRIAVESGGVRRFTYPLAEIEPILHPRLVDHRRAFGFQLFAHGFDHDGHHAFAAKGSQFADSLTGFFVLDAQGRHSFHLSTLSFHHSTIAEVEEYGVRGDDPEVAPCNGGWGLPLVRVPLRVGGGDTGEEIHGESGEEGAEDDPGPGRPERPPAVTIGEVDHDEAEHQEKPAPQPDPERNVPHFQGHNHGSRDHGEGPDRPDRPELGPIGEQVEPDHDQGHEAEDDRDDADGGRVHGGISV